MSIRVLLADDQVLLRSALAMLITQEPDMEIVGEAGDGDEAVRLTLRERPDVVLMDIRMPGSDGLNATMRILQDPSSEQTRVIMLTKPSLVNSRPMVTISCSWRDSPVSSAVTAIIGFRHGGGYGPFGTQE